MFGVESETTLKNVTAPVLGSEADSSMISIAGGDTRAAGLALNALTGVLDSVFGGRRWMGDEVAVDVLKAVLMIRKPAICIRSDLPQRANIPLVV